MSKRLRFRATAWQAFDRDSMTVIDVTDRGEHGYAWTVNVIGGPFIDGSHCTTAGGARAAGRRAVARYKAKRAAA